MSFKEKLPEIIIVATMSVTAGIFASYAYDQGLKQGFHEGYGCGKKYGRLEAEIDAVMADIKAHKESGKKEEASN